MRIELTIGGEVKQQIYNDFVDLLLKNGFKKSKDKNWFEYYFDLSVDDESKYYDLDSEISDYLKNHFLFFEYSLDDSGRHSSLLIKKRINGGNVLEYFFGYMENYSIPLYVLRDIPANESITDLVELYLKNEDAEIPKLIFSE